MFSSYALPELGRASTTNVNKLTNFEYASLFSSVFASPAGHRDRCGDAPQQRGRSEGGERAVDYAWRNGRQCILFAILPAMANAVAVSNSGRTDVQLDNVAKLP